MVMQDDMDNSVTRWILSWLSRKYTAKSTWTLIILEEGTVRPAFELNQVSFQCIRESTG